jgi:flagellin-like protein
MKRTSISEDKFGVSPVIAVILMVAITVVLAGVLYVWVTSLSEPSSNKLETLSATVKQGPGNLTSGCLILIEKGSGESVKHQNYIFRVGKKDGNLITLRWSQDGNISYPLDSGQRTNDGDWWDTKEIMGFDGPAGLEVGEGDVVEVHIVNLETGSVVYFDSFIYKNTN